MDGGGVGGPTSCTTDGKKYAYFGSQIGPAYLYGGLILIGNAEENTFNPYPMRRTSCGDGIPDVQEKDGNRFYSLRRSWYSSIIYSYIHNKCLETGVSYTTYSGGWVTYGG